MRTHQTARRPRHRRLILATAAASVFSLTNCTAQPLDATVALDYWLWDANQLLPYQECIDDFERQHENIEVRIGQYGWDDYWTKLTAGFVAGTGPDVFTNHIARFGEYMRRNLILDLDELDATSDVEVAAFQEGLIDLWRGPDGLRYGMPKDFDTIGIFYDENVVEEAGLDPEYLQNLEWNPQDGGSFEEVIARLSVDTNGVRGDEPGFNPSSVAVYGLASNGAGGPDGQTQWSWLAGANGWSHMNAEMWGEEFNFDDPALHETLEWYFGLVDKGFMPSFEEVGTDPNVQQQLGSGQAALAPEGSWMINTFAALDGVDLGIAQVPAGPVGHPVSMYNGLADSINTQTEHPEEAAQLVAHLASSDCQNIIAEATIVFPARVESTERAIAAFAEKGIDVSAFTDLVENEQTMFFPVMGNFGAVNAVMYPVMEDIYTGGRYPQTLVEVNDQLNQLLESGESGEE